MEGRTEQTLLFVMSSRKPEAAPAQREGVQPSSLRGKLPPRGTTPVVRNLQSPVSCQPRKQGNA